MAFIPVIVQIKLEINPDRYKTLKIKKFKFMFRATGGRSVSKDGITKFLFFFQLSGLYPCFFDHIAERIAINFN